MFGKSLSLFLVWLLLGGIYPPISFAQSSADDSAERNRTERIKNNVDRLEDSGKTRIVVRLRSGAKLKGYITKTEEDFFDVTDYDRRRTTSIAYGDVAEVKPQGGSSKAGKYALGIGAAAAIVVLIVTQSRNRPSGICPLGCGPF